MFNRRQAPARFLAAPIAVAALFAAVPADAQDAHGVIAFGQTDQGQGVAYGFSWNFHGKEAAHAEALNACISSGGTECVQLAWFQNGCGALAIDQYGNAQGKPGMSLEQAEARALRTCEAVGGSGCNVVGSVCAAPGGEPGIWSGSESVLPAYGSQTTAKGPEDESLTREERIRVQQNLTVLGFDAGPADGVFGRRTRSAIWEWQNANGLEATGHVTREQLASLTAVEASPTKEQNWEHQPETTDAQNYNACMEHCTRGKDFDYCHAICADKLDFADGSPPPPSLTTNKAARAASAVEAGPIKTCAAKLTYEEKKNLVYDDLIDSLSVHYRRVDLDKEENLRRAAEKTRNFSFVSGESSDEFEVAVQVLHSGRTYRQPGTTRMVTPLYWANCVAKGRMEFSTLDGECYYDYTTYFGKSPRYASNCEKDSSANEYCSIRKETVAGPCPR